MSLVYTGNQQRMTVELGSNYTAGSGTMSLTAGHGARLPAVSSPDVLYLKPTEAEIGGGATYQVWKVTGRSTDTLTVTGSQDGTTDTSVTAPLDLEWTIGEAALDQLKSDLGSAVKMTRDSGQSISGKTKILFDNVEFTYGTAITGDIVTNNRFDINEDGIYLISCFVAFEDPGNEDSVIPYISIDGTDIMYADKRARNNVEDSYGCITDVRNISAGSYIEMSVTTTSDTTETSAVLKPRMSVIRIN